MSRHIKTLVGVALSVLLLAWTLRGASLSDIAREIGHADPVLLAVTIGISLTGMAIRAVRWILLLRPVGHEVPFRSSFASIIIGFAANNVLPARVGEFARALTLARITSVSVAPAFATLVVERIFDAVVLVGLLFASMAAPGFPIVGDVGGVSPRAAAATVAVLMAAVGGALFLMVVTPAPFVRGATRMVRPLPPRAGEVIVRALQSFVAGLAVLRSGRLFALSFGLALLQWWFTAWSYLTALRAFGIEDVPFSGGVFMQSLIALAVAVPSSPGFFGPFEAAAKLGLGLWAVPADKAISFAVGLHLSGFIPVTLMGFYYVARLNLSWSDVRHSDETVEEVVEEGAGSGVPTRTGAAEGR